MATKGILKNFSKIGPFLSSLLEACVAEQLTPQILDLEGQGSSLAWHIVSLDKELYSTLSLFAQVYKIMGTPDILLGGGEGGG